jgi:hypothetical protein
VADGWAKVRAAAADRTGGAAEVARTAAEGLAALPARDASRAVRLLLAGHPAMAPLWRLATDVLSAPGPAEGTARFLDRLRRDQEAAGALAPHLPPWVVTVSSSSSVLRALAAARRVRVVACMESLPGGEGRLMALALREAGKEARVVPDEEAVRTLPGRAVVVGADAVTPSAVVNKAGTRALAEAARARDVPCFVVAGETKFVAEPLPAEELLEPTPLDLFTAVATPWGLLSPEEARARARDVPFHPDLLPYLADLRRGSRPPPT